MNNLSISNLPKLITAKIRHLIFKFRHLGVPGYFGPSVLRKGIDIRFIQPFESIATPIIKSKRTFLYYDRLYLLYESLVSLSRVFNNVNLFTTVEIGVFRGGGSKFIFDTARVLNLPVNHYSFDTFEGHSEIDVSDGQDGKHKKGNFNETSFEDVCCFLNSGSENIIVTKGRFQDSCNLLNGQKVHFAHLDVDLYEPTLFSLRFLQKLMPEGAIIVVDDYGSTGCPGVMRSVDEFMEDNNRFVKIHVFANQAVLIKVS